MSVLTHHIYIAYYKITDVMDKMKMGSGVRGVGGL